MPVPDVVDAQLRLQFLGPGRDVVLSRECDDE
jgi:hypothetical protein